MFAIDGGAGRGLHNVSATMSVIVCLLRPVETNQCSLVFNDTTCLHVKNDQLSIKHFNGKFWFMDKVLFQNML